MDIIEGDCVERMRELEEASVDAIVCDPPYGLEFMGKEWDRLGRNSPPSFEHSMQNDFKGFKPLPRPGGLTIEGMHKAQEWHQAWVTEALRVLKPGGHLLAFGGTRTYHRLACAIEDAGFEIRDSLIWLQGSGFPKSLDVSKAIDKARDDRPDARAVTAFLNTAKAQAKLTEADVELHFEMGHRSVCHWFQDRHPQVPTMGQWAELKGLLSLTDEMDAEVWRLNGRKGKPGDNWEKRELIRERTMVQGGGNSYELREGERREVEANITASCHLPECEGSDDASTEMRSMRRANQVGEVQGPEPRPKVVGAGCAPGCPVRWEGWGTALKPGHEPIVMARKPLTGTVAQNVTQHGTGALNIDGARIGTEENTARERAIVRDTAAPFGRGAEMGGNGSPLGRWPANVLLSHLPECVEVGTRKVKGSDARKADGTKSEKMGETWSEGSGLRPERSTSPATYNSPDGTETITAYNCAPGCPIAELDEQSGELGKSQGIAKWSGHTTYQWSKSHPKGSIEPQYGTEIGYGDDGGASRFFKQTTEHKGEQDAGRPDTPSAVDGRDPGNGAEDAPGVHSEAGGGPEGVHAIDCDLDEDCTCRFRYVAKASRGERNAGLDGFEERETAAMQGNLVDGQRLAGDGTPIRTPVRQNVHPTVKPIDLMRWLVRLVTPPGGTVLDPFTGSGTTGIAAVLEGFDFLGIEREAEYVAIARARIGWWEKHAGRDTEDVLVEAGYSERIQATHREAGQLDLLG